MQSKDQYHAPLAPGTSSLLCTFLKLTLHLQLFCSVFGDLGKETEGQKWPDVAIISWLALILLAALVAMPLNKRWHSGGGVLPAAVVMPRRRQVYSSPVQNTWSFMVPEVRAESQQGRQQGLWP